MVLEQRSGKDPVAQIGLGNRTQTDHSAPLSNAGYFVGREVRRVNKAPLLVDRHPVEQELDRSRAMCGEAIIHFKRLLGDMDIDGA